MDLKVSAISFNNISSASTYGAQQTGLRPPPQAPTSQNVTERAKSDGPGSSVVGDTEKLGQLSSLYDIDSESLNSASSAKELVDTLQQNGVDLGRLRSVLNSGDLLDTTA